MTTSVPDGITIRQHAFSKIGVLAMILKSNRVILHMVQTISTRHVKCHSYEDDIEDLITLKNFSFSSTFCWSGRQIPSVLLLLLVVFQNTVGCLVFFTVKQISLQRDV